MEKQLFHVKLEDRKRNVLIRIKTKVWDFIGDVAELKWKFADKY